MEHWLEREIDEWVANEGRKVLLLLFNNVHNTFAYQLHGVGHIVKDHSGDESGNPLPPQQELLFRLAANHPLYNF